MRSGISTWFGVASLLLSTGICQRYSRLFRRLSRPFAHPACDVSEHARVRPDTAWIDSAKGVAIVLVVLGHAWRGCANAGLFNGMPPWLFAAIDARIYAFHMPLFFLISGLFLVRSLEKASVSEFVTGRLVRLLWPLVLWTYLFAGAKVLAGQMANTPLTLSSIPHFPIPGRWQFWFLWALFLLHMGVLVLRPLLLTPGTRRITLWALVLCGVIMNHAGGPPELNYWTNRALLYLPFLAAGMLLAEHDLLRPVPRGAAWSALALFVGTLAVIPALSGPHLWMWLGLGLCLALLAALSRLGELLPGAMQALALLGGASMAIYLTHTFFSAGVRMALLSAEVSALGLHVVLGTASGILFPLLLLWTIRKAGRPVILGF